MSDPWRGIDREALEVRLEVLAGREISIGELKTLLRRAVARGVRIASLSVDWGEKRTGVLEMADRIETGAADA